MRRARERACPGRWLAGLALGAALACAPTGPAPRGEPSAGAGLALPLPAPAGAPDTLAVVTVAGLTPLHYRGRDGRPAVMPTVAALAEAGVSADAVRVVAPATKYPAHATLVTGRTPAEHGIPADLVVGPNGVRDAFYWHASHLEASTLWQLVTQQGRSVAALAWPSTLGASIPLLLPDLVPTRREETWLSVLSGAATPPVLALAREEGGADPGADLPGAARDAALAGVACRLLSAPVAPALLLLHLSQTERAIASHGPSSHEADAAFARADREIARLLSCLDRVGRLPTAAFAVLGDHGTVAVHSVVQPNVVLAQEGLLSPRNGSIGGLRRWSALARSNGGSAFVYAKSDDAAVAARRALSDAAEHSGAFRVVSAREMIELGADPTAWFGLEAEPGFAFSDAASPPLVRAAARRGTGGYLSLRPEMDAGFVAWGRGLRSGLRIPVMQQTDVAPTFARLLGVDLVGATGRTLVGILSLPAELP